MLALVHACIVEHGPGVTLATLSAAVGLSPPALIKRFGSKEELLFQALLPAEAPRWRRVLEDSPGEDAALTLQQVLVELCEGFAAVGPALAALRMSRLEVGRVFPPDRPGPPVIARRLLAGWLERIGVAESGVLAELAVGAAEARGFHSWVGPQMLDRADHEAWAAELVEVLLRRSNLPAHDHRG